MANPDGYIYTWRDKNDIATRLWRKNTNNVTDYKTNLERQDPTCFGVDLNRNFGFHWNGII